MPERKIVPRFVKRVRLEAMLDAVSRGVTSGDEIARHANEAARKETDKLGLMSVQKFVRVAPKIAVVDRIRKSTPTEDREWHTDMWIILKKPIAGRRMFPLEIKSSDTGVNEFKNSKDFKINPFYLVINSRKSRKDKEIIKDFMNELQRVATALELRKKP